MKKINKPLTVLLVEDDRDECKAFTQYIESTEDVRLIGTANNDKKALEYVKDFLPDAIILDLELHKGGGTGIAFLEALNKAKMKVPPYILVTTHNISRITHEQVRQLGADFIMVKSQGDYSARSVVEFLISLRKIIYCVQESKRGKSDIVEDSPAEQKKRLTTRVSAEIDLIGISPKALGRSYLIDAVIHKIGGQSNMTAIIAQKYGKTGASIERAMQNAINRAWSTMHPDDLMLHYTSRVRSEKGVPTLIEFISHYANKLEVEY